jgi:DNA mismatch endonuclease (patch repair protein)
MSLIRSKGNQTTEITFARLLRKNRITGWRRHLHLPGKPDFSFLREKVAVFLDGCFWHACPRCYRRPATNTRFWDRKRADNLARDRRVGRELQAIGFCVIRIYEHELKVPARVIRRVLKRLSVKAAPR